MRLAPSVSLVIPIAERCGVILNYLPEWWLAKSEVFTSFGQSLSARGWLDLTPKTRISIGYSYRYGDVNSYAIPPRPDLVAVMVTKAHSTVFGRDRVVYRIVANTHTVERRLTHNLSDRISLSASYRWETTLGPGDLYYLNNIVEVGVRAQF